MSRLGGCLIHKTISKWTTNSFTNYPSKQCYLIINRYINSDTLFNEINASFEKLKENKHSQTKSFNIEQSIPTNKHKSKQSKKHKSSKNKLIQKSVSLTDNNNKSSTLKQHNNDYLSQIKSTNKSIFNKYEIIARNLQQENKQEKELIKSSKKKENIDKYIRKQIVEKEKYKKQKFQDPILSELDHYDISLPDLISTQNIIKTKASKSENTLVKYDESELSQLTLSDEIITTNQYDAYNEMFNGLIEMNPDDKNKKMNEKELIKSIDWTRLENYVELNGWNNFAEFLNETENENELQKYTIPSFLSEIPKVRKTYDRPKAKILGNEENAFKLYKINEKVNIEACKYLRNGNVGLLINNKHYGFIKRHNLPIDIQIGEYHTGYVYDINYFGKIEVIMEKPNFWSRMSECQRRIINILKYCNGSIEISDKSDAKMIRQMFEMSKKNFKRALGMLLKNGVVEIFNENDADVASKIILNRNKIDLQGYDVGKELEERMWKSKPIWEYGVSAPPFADILPDEMKERKKKQQQIYQRKFTVRKKA